MVFKSKEKVIASAETKISNGLDFSELNNREKRLYGEYLTLQQKQEEQQLEEEKTLENDIIIKEVKKETIQLNDSIHLNTQLLALQGQLKQERKELNNAKNGQGKAIRKAVRDYFNKIFDNANNRINATTSGKYTNLDTNHIKGLIAKSQLLLQLARDYKSQLVTGDIDEARRFFPPNIFDDANFYMPDVAPGQRTKKSKNNFSISTPGCDTAPNYDPTIDKVNHGGSAGEQFADNGVLGAMNAGLENMGASPDTRSRAYKVGNIVRGATKLIGGIRAGWGLLKSTRKSISGAKKEDGTSYFGDMAKYGAILAGGYVMGPSIDKIIRGGDTSKRAAEKLSLTAGASPKDTKELVKDAELSIDARLTVKLFENIPWQDWKQFTNAQGVVNFEDLKGYLLEKEGLTGERYKLLTEIESSNNTSRIQNLLTGLGITGSYLTQKIQHNPDETITKTYEEAKIKADKIAETYNFEDTAKVRPMLDDIETSMEDSKNSNLLSFKNNRMDIEKELNILHIKHPKAHPISIGFNETTNMLEISSYKQKTALSLGNPPICTTPYHTTPRAPTNLNEGIRLANLYNFLTDPNKQLINSSTVENPFHSSSITGDIEFLKTPAREAIKQLKRGNLKDTSVLNDSFRSPRLKELYPSIANNKQGFISWLNNFKHPNGKSLWQK